MNFSGDLMTFLNQNPMFFVVQHYSSSNHNVLRYGVYINNICVYKYIFANIDIVCILCIICISMIRKINVMHIFLRLDSNRLSSHDANGSTLRGTHCQWALPKAAFPQLWQSNEDSNGITSFTKLGLVLNTRVTPNHLYPRRNSLKASAPTSIKTLTGNFIK